jgi:hypothetical protein
MPALLINPLPDILFANIERSGDMPHEIGDQQSVLLMSGAPLRRIYVTLDIAAFVREHDHERVFDLEGRRLPNQRAGRASSRALRAQMTASFCFAHLFSLSPAARGDAHQSVEPLRCVEQFAALASEDDRGAMRLTSSRRSTSERRVR